MTLVRKALRPLVNTAILLTMLFMPLALMPGVNAGTSVTIEAPSQAKKGLGLVLLVSLQRS